MGISKIYRKLEELRQSFLGEIHIDEATRLIYATDASAYREKPLAVVMPKNKDDIKTLITFAKENKTAIIPRTAGTSLAGQVVGNGIVADVSKYMTEIIELNVEEKWVKVQPGVILDELNIFLKEHGLFFGPETSTSNRCMIGGMLGNNSCGAHSLVYGSTRDHTISAKVILSDGSDIEFKSVDNKEFEEKCKLNTLEGNIYKNINNTLSNNINQENIRTEFPDPKLERRNTGYAVDLLLESSPFTQGKENFNFCKLLAGSEGTLAFTYEIKLNLVSLPPKEKALMCIHMESLEDTFKGNLIALEEKPVSVELMDDIIIELSSKNTEQQKNKFFIKGHPKAILIVEFAEEDKEVLQKKLGNLESKLRAANYGYHFPVVTGSDIGKVWALRKAGLGILANIPGDAKPAPVIEDTAVVAEVLPDYMREFKEIMVKYGKECVYYAHIATGEIHLRPILNLKDKKDIELFHDIALDVAKLVKKYKGSISGEHGDGRLRGQFIPLMIGEQNYKLLLDIKETWDPQHIFNPEKIVNTPKMNTSLRYKPGQETRMVDTIFNWDKDQGILRAAEKCNGTAACRKTEVVGGTMCPSYMATRDEKATTRARANILREFLTNSPKENPYDHDEIYKIMDLCLSCKACKSECPSNVDVAKLKAEFLQHYYDAHSIPLRTRAIAEISKINALGSIFPAVTNFFMSHPFFSKLMMKTLGFSEHRKMPLLYKTTLDRWFNHNKKKLEANTNTPNKGKVYLFNDEFTKFNDTEIGIKGIQVLTKLGYEVIIPRHDVSGRTYLSKGLLRQAKKIANTNIQLLKDIITNETPLIGVEPSAILAFRDEYPELAIPELKEAADQLAKNSYLFEEFIAREIDAGNIIKEQFTKEKQKIKLHGHCQQKAVASTMTSKKVLSFPENYTVEEIPSGCCGMAGSFGYEKEHYEVSMKVGELVLFPAIRSSEPDTIISAPGTSCRHQIKDGTQRTAFHPIEILFAAMILE
ncbi:MAG: FAD-binding and (Fe-S)-binding domain-containing protein [Hyphomicrobiales bacterium]